MMEKLLNVKEVSQTTGIPQKTLWDMCRNRKIPCYKIGRIYKLRESEVNKWLETKKQKVVKNVRVDLVKEFRVEL